MPSILAGVPGHPVEDIKIHDVYVEQAGGGTAEMAARTPDERENAYPEPGMFGALPATGLFARHVRNLEVSNFEIATRNTDARPAFWLGDVNGADFFRVRTPQGASAFDLRQVTDFRNFGSRGLADISLAKTDERKI
jgi:hypothetical protein